MTQTARGIEISFRSSETGDGKEEERRKGGRKMGKKCRKKERKR